MNITIIYFVTQTLLRLNLVLEQRPPLMDGLDTMIDGLLWDCGTWLILCLPVLLLMNFFSRDKLVFVEKVKIPFFFLLGCVDYLWLERIYPMGMNIIGVSIVLIGFALIASYSTTQMNIKLPKMSPRISLIALSVATLCFVLVVGPWLDKHEENKMDDKLARNGLYEISTIVASSL